MAPRNAFLQVSRPFLFRPFTSVTTPAQDTKTPAFEFLIPRQDETFILLSEAKWPTTRFVYLFVDASFLSDTTLEGAVIRVAAGAEASGNPMIAVIRVEPNGDQSLCVGARYRDAIAANSPVPFEKVEKTEHAAVEPPSDDNLKGAYAVAAPVLLPLEAISQLENNRPQVLPLLGTGMGIGVAAPVQETPANPEWVFPVVDPLLIAENLTRKFYEAADNFLAASQQIDRPPARNDAEKTAREQGELLRLRKTVADNLLALRGAAPKLASTFSDTMQPGLPDSFIGEYRRQLDELVFQRELAAFQLIAWLESDLFALSDDWWERKQGKPNPDYEVYVRTVLAGLARLAESDRGLKFLMDLRNRLEQGASPVQSGVLHVTSEFVFRSTQSTSEQLTIAVKTGTALFGTWSSFVTAALAVRQRVVKGPNPTTTLIEDMKAFANRLTFVFQEGVLTVKVDDIQAEVVIPGGTKRTVVDIPTPSFIPSQKAASFIKSLKGATEHGARVCAVLNFGLAYAAFRSALQEAGDQRAKNMAISDLAGASLGVLDQTLALPVLEAFRSKMAGKINMGGALLGNRVASTLGLLGAVASLTSAALATAQEIDRGDWDEAAAHITEGFGAVLSGVGATVILVSGTTGPFALWTIFAGSAISAAGFLWSIFAADTEIDQMLKFSAFGRQSGQAALQPPGWSQCANSFAEWDATTQAGLLRQLRAFQQIFYSFEASGATPVGVGPLASEAVLRITPSSLRLACSFEIDYKATYSVPGAGNDGPVTRSGKARVIIPATPDQAPSLIDLNGNYEVAGAVRVHKDEGRDALDVRFRLLKELTNKSGSPLEIETLTCQIQLKIPNMGTQGGKDETLIVPTTAKGPQVLELKPVERRQTVVAPQRSVKV